MSIVTVRIRNEFLAGTRQRARLDAEAPGVGGTFINHGPADVVVSASPDGEAGAVVAVGDTSPAFTATHHWLTAAPTRPYWVEDVPPIYLPDPASLSESTEANITCRGLRVEGVIDP